MKSTRLRWHLNGEAAYAQNVKPHKLAIKKSIFLTQKNVLCATHLNNAYPSHSLCTMSKVYFIFLRTEVLFRGGGQRGQNPPFSFFCKKTRACSVYNGLTLRRRRCFTLVAHSWKFWTNVFCLRYCTEVLYVYMYSFMNVFLNPYTEEECNSFSSSCLLYRLFWRLSGDPACTQSGGPYFYGTVILYVLWFVF